MRSKLYALLSALLLGSTLFLSNAPASAAEALVEGDQTHRNCIITLAPIPPGETSSKILGKTCMVETVAETEQRLTRRADATLAVFWSDVDLSGDSTTVEGSETCDNEGYGISDMDGIHDEVGGGGVSSYELLGSCDVSEKFSDYDFEGTSSGLIRGKSQPWVGASWNDGGIKSFWLLNG